jgi:hypothetical protein
MTTTHHNKTTMLIPADVLYWALLEPGDFPQSSNALTSRATRRRLGYAFERVLPLPIEQVHAVYMRTERAILACGIDLPQLQAALDQGKMFIQPATIPDWIDTQATPYSINLATHEATPSVLLAARTRMVRTTVIALTGLLILIALGFHLRAHNLNTAAAQLRQQAEASINNQLGSIATTQLPILRLAAELRRIRAIATSTTHYTGPSDASTSLIAILEAWPDAITTQTEALSATHTTLRVRTKHPNQSSADAFAAAWKPPSSHWQTRQPTMSTQRDIIQLELVAERRSGT